MDEKMDEALRYQHDLGFDEGYEQGYEDGFADGCAQVRDPDEGKEVDA